MLTFLYFCNVKDISELQANGKTNAVFLTYTDIGRHILIVIKCVYLYQYKSNTPFGTDKLPVWYGVSPCLSGTVVFAVY